MLASGAWRVLPAMWHAAIAVEGRPRVHPARALGLAVNYLITKPAFAKLPFGLWSRILVGQINRGHYLLALDRNKLVGFLGWALTKGDIRLAGRGEFSYADSLAGDILLINRIACSQSWRGLLDPGVSRCGQDLNLRGL